MQANIMFFHTPSTPGGSKWQNLLFTESSHVAYQIKGNGTYEGHPIKNETFAIVQWIYTLDLWNLIQS